jgi:hypothetical protein
MVTMAGQGGIDDETPGWQSPGFGWLFLHGILRGVVGGWVLGIAYGVLVIWVWGLTGAALTWEPDGLGLLLLLPYGIIFGLIGGLLAGLVAGLLLGLVIGGWLVSPGVRGVPVQRLVAFARGIAGLLTGALVCVVMLNDTDAGTEKFVFFDLLPAAIAVAYGAWTGGRLVQTGAIRAGQDAEGRLPA